MAVTILSYLWRSLSATLVQILILVLPGLILAFILNYVSALIQNRSIKVMGTFRYVILFGWLGTVIHEFGHAIFCAIFGHKIKEIKMFRPDPETGTLGYITHSYNRANVYQLAGNFFIGVGPIVLGTAVIYLLAFWLLDINFVSLSTNVSIPASQLISWNGIADLFQNLMNSSINTFTQLFSWQNVSSLQLYVFIYLVFAIGSSITLSVPDIKAAASGFGVIVLLWFIANLASAWAGNLLTNVSLTIAGYFILFYSAGFLILLINAAVGLLVLLPLSLRTRHAVN